MSEGNFFERFTRRFTTSKQGEAGIPKNPNLSNKEHPEVIISDTEKAFAKAKQAEQEQKISDKKRIEELKTQKPPHGGVSPFDKPETARHFVSLEEIKNKYPKNTKIEYTTLKGKVMEAEVVGYSEDKNPGLIVKTTSGQEFAINGDSVNERVHPIEEISREERKAA